MLNDRDDVTLAQSADVSSSTFRTFQDGVRGHNGRSDHGHGDEVHRESDYKWAQSEKGTHYERSCVICIYWTTKWNY